MKFLLDSNIIIYHLNNESIATQFLEENYKNIAISQITYIEVLSFTFTDKERNAVEKLLRSFRILDVTFPISKQAIENRQIKKIKIPDNIIASTAMVHNLILVTRNTKDFKQISINIFNPFS